MPRTLIRFAKRVPHLKNWVMKIPSKLDVAGLRPLSTDEMQNIHGGSIVSYLLKFAAWGAGYFFNMGVREGRRMRAFL